MFMKKTVTAVLTFVCGSLANAALCAAGLFLGALNVFVYALCAAAFGLGLAIGVNNAADKLSKYLPKPAFIACAEAPMFALVLVNFFTSLRDTEKCFVRFTLFRNDYTRAIALNMLITSAATAAFSIVVAVFRRKKRAHFL